MEEVTIIDPQTGRTLTTTQKAWQKYYAPQGYMEDTDEVVLMSADTDGNWSEFFAADEEQPSSASRRPKRPLTGAAKAAAERKARQAQQT
jgi:hypothetical protein